MGLFCAHRSSQRRPSSSCRLRRSLCFGARGPQRGAAGRCRGTGGAVAPVAGGPATRSRCVAHAQRGFIVRTLYVNAHLHHPQQALNHDPKTPKYVCCSPAIQSSMQQATSSLPGLYQPGGGSRRPLHASPAPARPAPPPPPRPKPQFAEVVPFTQRRHTLLVPLPLELQMGEASYRSFLEQQAAKGKLLSKRSP